MAAEGVNLERLISLSSHKAFCFLLCGSTLEHTARDLTCGATFFDKAEKWWRKAALSISCDGCRPTCPHLIAPVVTTN